MHKIELFVPPAIAPQALDMNKLSSVTGKEYVYCSRGRHAIFHALKALDVSGTVVIPGYSCPTIRDSILSAGLKYECCDIDADDLNIDFNTFIKICEKQSISCVIVPSLYGNPADLISFENFCRDNQIKMIDDSAQSFGAILNQRYLSTFGNAGLFAFSPGKATPAPMGAFLWYEGDYNWKYTSHPITHRLIYRNYKINRQEAYKNHNIICKKSVLCASRLMEKLFDISCDIMNSFERNTLGASIEQNLNNGLNFRKHYYDAFINQFSSNDNFRIVISKRGIPNNHKIVILLNDKNQKADFLDYLNYTQVRTYSGYNIVGDKSILPVADDITSRIIELPIENNAINMLYLFSVIKEYFIL